MTHHLSLTPAEKNIFDIVVNEGLTAKEIAVKLSVKKRTVEGHIHNIHMKAGVNNTKKLIAMYYQGEIVT